MRLLVPLALAVLGYQLVAFVAQRAMLFPAPRSAPAPPDLERWGVERHWLRLDGGRVEAWLLRPAAAGRAAPLLLFAHGNGELIDHWVREFEEPRSWGLGVLLVEYPGYGRSEGRPSEASITAAMVAAWDWAVDRQDIDRDRIVAHGRSVGGGAAAALARRRPVAALVLESSFTSVRRMARRFGVPGFLVRDPFDNLSALHEYGGPVLLVHGARDEIIPVAHAHALHAASSTSELHLVPCGHNDCPAPWALLREFLERNSLLHTAGPAPAN